MHPRAKSVSRGIVMGASQASRGVLTALPEPLRGFADAPVSSAPSSSARHPGAIPVPSGGGTARHGDSEDASAALILLSQGASTERGSGGSQGGLVLDAEEFVSMVEYSVKKALDRRLGVINDKRDPGRGRTDNTWHRTSEPTTPTASKGRE